MQLSRLIHTEVIEKVCHTVYMTRVNSRGFSVGLLFISVSQMNRGFTTNANIWIQSGHMNTLFFSHKENHISICVKAQLGK